MPRICWHTIFTGGKQVVRQAIETAGISPRSGGHSSSYWCQQGQVPRLGRRCSRGRLVPVLWQIELGAVLVQSPVDRSFLQWPVVLEFLGDLRGLWRALSGRTAWPHYGCRAAAVLVAMSAC